MRLQTNDMRQRQLNNHRKKVISGKHSEPQRYTDGQTDQQKDRVVKKGTEVKADGFVEIVTERDIVQQTTTSTLVSYCGSAAAGSSHGYFLGKIKEMRDIIGTVW